MIKLYAILLAILAVMIFSAAPPSFAGPLDEESVIIDFDVLENFRKPPPPEPATAAIPPVVDVMMLPLEPPLPARKPAYNRPVKPAPASIKAIVEVEPEVTRLSPAPAPKAQKQPEPQSQEPPPAPPAPQPKAEPPEEIVEEPSQEPQPQDITETAPRAAHPASLDTISFAYQPGEIAPPRGAQQVISQQVLPLLQQNLHMRLSIISYASPDNQGQSSARRISLARGIMLRKQLIELGAAPDSIDIKPRGTEGHEDQSVDRIDLEFIR